LLFGLPLLLFAQVELIDIPKRVNKIIIQNELTKKKNFALIGETLVSNGLTPEKLEEAFGLITTEPVKLSKINGFNKYRFVVKDKTIEITAECGLPGLIEYSQTSNIGMKGSLVRRSFEEMVALIQKIPGGEISFVKE